MTDCPDGDVRDLLPDLLHDRLSPAVRREVEAHVRDCADCRDELALLRSMRSTLGRAPAVDVAAIAAAIPPYHAAGRRSWGGWRAAAAVALLAAGGTSVAVLQRGATNVRDTATAGVAVGSSTASPAPVNEAREDSALPTAAVPAPRELAVASSSIGDLDDAELSALLKDLATVDVLPPVDVEPTTAISPVSPTGTE